MSISAQVIADSISPDGVRITTMQLRYPRFIHAEFMTHRMFSRNASSSRAIPVKRMIEDLRRDPAMPVHWGSNKPGMQAGDELTGHEWVYAHEHWLLAMEEAIKRAEKLVALGLHKQIANRILEPWAHINVVVTATDWDNFYALRRHEDAQPEIKALADAMWDAQQDSGPKLLEPGEWHLPYYNEEQDYQAIKEKWITEIHPKIADKQLPGEMTNMLFEKLVDTTSKQISVARCARVSYLTHDGRQTSIEEDIQLYKRLVGSQPLHASPAEHQATPDRRDPDYTNKWGYPDRHGNFRGWIQFRKTLPGECVPST